MSETWYHLTNRARFKLDPQHAPADNSIAIVDRSGRPGIYIAKDVEAWVNGYGYWRPFVVELQVDPSVVNDPGVHGRWGGEMFVPASSFDKLTIERVIPIDAYAREEYGESGWIESSLGVAFDTGEPLIEPGHPGWSEQKAEYKGYRYQGPDVRAMPQAEVARLKKQLRQAKGDEPVVTENFQPPKRVRKVAHEQVGPTDAIPPDIAQAFTALGYAQRGAPERAMNEVQEAAGGGLLSYLVENVGDLTHRMSHMADWWGGRGNDGYEYVKPKVDGALSVLRSEYGIDRDVREQLQSNAKHDGVSFDSFMVRVEATLAKYVETHRALPVYNRAQWLARQATIEVGQMDWRDARWSLSALELLLATPETWRAAAFEYERGSGGQILQYPWPKENVRGA